jgi:hypothetical protein
MQRDYIQVSPSAPPQLFVTVDTEEEFDWSRPFARENVSVEAARSIGRLQSLFAAWRVVPTYVVDYPIASQIEGYRVLADFERSGAAIIGAHLHPWVNPPLTETLSRGNSFGCALGLTLETEKIRLLRDRIEDSFGVRPRVFKAGRYGFGATTATALESLGFDVDLSINPRMNFSIEGGPSFSRFDTRPFFFGSHRKILEIPCTTDYAGVAARFGRPLHQAASHPSVQWARPVGVLSRLGIVDRVTLSPEGHTLDEMKAVTRSLMARGIRTFSLTMHSPSVKPGCTPYVRTAADLAAFMERLNRYCEFFLGELDGMPSTPLAFLGACCREAGEAA